MNYKTLSILGVALAAASAGAQNAQLHAAVGKPAPAFIMKDVNGATYKNSSFKGKVVLLDFWATWCGPCKMASPAIQKLYANYAKKGLVAIGADTFEHNADPFKGAKSYATSHKFTYKFTAMNDGLAQSLGIESIPAFVILDRKGVIRYVTNGVPQGGAAPLYVALESQVKKLLAEK